jgi:hypothetical protein
MIVDGFAMSQSISTPFLDPLLQEVEMALTTQPNHIQKRISFSNPIPHQRGKLPWS